MTTADFRLFDPERSSPIRPHPSRGRSGLGVPRRRQHPPELRSGCPAPAPVAPAPAPVSLDRPLTDAPLQPDHVPDARACRAGGTNLHLASSVRRWYHSVRFAIALRTPPGLLQQAAPSHEQTFPCPRHAEFARIASAHLPDRSARCRQPDGRSSSSGSTTTPSACTRASTGSPPSSLPTAPPWTTTKTASGYDRGQQGGQVTADGAEFSTGHQLPPGIVMGRSLWPSRSDPLSPAHICGASSSANS